MIITDANYLCFIGGFLLGIATGMLFLELHQYERKK